MKRLSLPVALAFWPMVLTGMAQPDRPVKNPESLQTLCLKHFLYNTNKIRDAQLKRILSREKMDPFEEYEHLFEKKVNPELAARLQILLFHDLKPSPHLPMLSILTRDWPASEPVTGLQNTLALILEKKLTSKSEICSAVHHILLTQVAYPRFGLAEFLIENGLQNDLHEYFQRYPNTLRVWPTINYGNLSNNMLQFLKKIASCALPAECRNSFFRLAVQRRVTHAQIEYDEIIALLIQNGADASLLSVHEQEQLSCLRINR